MITETKATKRFVIFPLSPISGGTAAVGPLLMGLKSPRVLPGVPSPACAGSLRGSSDDESGPP